MPWLRSWPLWSALVPVLLLASCGEQPQGPLRPVRTVNSFGFPVERDRPFSFVFWQRSEQEVTATLERVSLIEPDPGLELVGSGISPTDLHNPLYRTFPPAPLTPVEGATVTMVPGDPSMDVTFVLGLRATAQSGALAARGILLEYEVDGRPYRAHLPWLLRVCIEPVASVCRSQDPTLFSFPPE